MNNELRRKWNLKIKILLAVKDGPLSGRQLGDKVVKQRKDGKVNRVFDRLHILSCAHGLYQEGWLSRENLKFVWNENSKTNLEKLEKLIN